MMKCCYVHMFVYNIYTYIYLQRSKELLGKICNRKYDITNTILLQSNTLCISLSARINFSRHSLRRYVYYCLFRLYLSLSLSTDLVATYCFTFLQNFFVTIIKIRIYVYKWQFIFIKTKTVIRRYITIMTRIRPKLIIVNLANDQ